MCGQPVIDEADGLSSTTVQAVPNLGERAGRGNGPPKRIVLEGVFVPRNEEVEAAICRALVQVDCRATELRSPMAQLAPYWIRGSFLKLHQTHLTLYQSGSSLSIISRLRNRVSEMERKSRNFPAGTTRTY